MAQAPQAQEAVPEKKSSKKLIIIFAAAVLLLGGGGAAAWFFMKKPADGTHKEVKKEALKPPVFVTLDTFTVNLQPDPDQQFLQVDMSLKVADDKQSELIKLHMPEVRNRLLMLLSSKKASEVTTIEGKKVLSEEIVAQVKQPFSPGEKPVDVSGVFFTSFVVQ